MYFDGSLMKTRAGAGLLFISPLGKHLRYVIRLHFPVSNNMVEYEALVNGLRITVELGVRCLDARGDSQHVIDQVMKNSHCYDRKMEAYCDKVLRLEDKFYGLELNHVARRFNETVDELAKIASGRTPDQPKGLAGPARRSSGCCLTTFGAVSAVSATLPRPKGLTPRLPSGRLGASATTRRSWAPQAYSPLGRAIHHRQDLEAWNIQAGQRSRRGLQQRLEHRTATSLLPLKCFKSFMFLVFTRLKKV
jgi:ribonuclease HI